jgi:DNA-binding response OmpR family regulator
MATILVVEHDFGTRIRMTELLRAGGYDVRGVVDTVAAIEGLGPHLPSAVVLSLQSDGVSTQNLCIAIRQAVFTVPVVVLGPDIDVTTKVTLFEVGADEYIV